MTHLREPNSQQRKANEGGHQVKGEPLEETEEDSDDTTYNNDVLKNNYKDSSSGQNKTF